MIKYAFAIAAAALSTSAIMFSPAAYAEAAAPTTKLTWQDLDLSTPAGKRELARRTEMAAMAVCPEDQVTGSHLRQQSVNECRASVRAQVAHKVAAGNRVALGN